MTRRRWPLLVIGASAGAATWSGWVGLGTLTGFGVVHPLPGIADQITINTAITLPVGMEAYAVYALAVATGPTSVPARARLFAWTSSVIALLLGMSGQITYHLLESWGWRSAPWWVTAAVSCVPVAVLGAAAVLWHLTGHPTNTEPVQSPIAAAIADRIRPRPTPAEAPVPTPAEPVWQLTDDAPSNEIGRAALTHHAMDELTANPRWRPPYDALTERFKLTRRGAEKAVAEARRQIRDRTTEPAPRDVAWLQVESSRKSRP